MDRKRWSSIARAAGVASGAGILVGVTLGSRIARVFASGAGVVAASDMLVRYVHRAVLRRIIELEMEENERRIERSLFLDATSAPAG